MRESILIVLCGLVITANAASPLFDEEFNGNSLDTNNWYVDVVQQSHNNELQYYTDRVENIAVEDGRLVITPRKENYGGKSYTSGRINSKFSWKYGKVDVRAKLPVGYGLWPAIWMMPQDSVYGGWPKSGEIDICEARGEFPYQIASTIHYGDLPCCNNHYWESSGDLDIAGTTGAYHVYSLEWTPTALVYLLDDVPYYTQDIDRVIGYMYEQKGQPFDQLFHLILNIAIGGDYVNNPSQSTNWNYPDAEMWVDYVRVYDLGYISDYLCAPTAASEYVDICNGVEWSCGSENTFADVSSECTQELLSCCSTADCTLLELKQLATGVYDAYDQQVNDGASCDFGGTAERQYILKDFGYAPLPQCLVKDDANPYEICGSMQWACGSGNTYADVTAECNAASDVLACCAQDAYSCDQSRLRQGAGSVFNAYYQQIPSSSSCDFGGTCYLSGITQPLECQDGYGA